MSSVFVVDACRTPIGKVKGSLAEVRPDHLAAGVLRALFGQGVPTLDDTLDNLANFIEEHIGTRVLMSLLA